MQAGFLGWTLVALGVAGEGVAEYFVNDGETNLRAFDQAVLSETQRSANSAAFAASLADTFADKADATAKSALDKSKMANGVAGKAQEKADAAGKLAGALDQYTGVIAKNVNPRGIDGPRFVALMRGQPKGVAEIWYEPNDDETEFFAKGMGGCLADERIGWQAIVNPLPSNANTGSRFLDELRQAARGSNGLAYGTRTFSRDLNSPEQKLWDAVNFSLGGWGLGGAMMLSDPALPDKHFVIVVGHHWPNVPLVQFAPFEHKIKKQNK